MCLYEMLHHGSAAFRTAGRSTETRYRNGGDAISIGDRWSVSDASSIALGRHLGHQPIVEEIG